MTVTGVGSGKDFKLWPGGGRAWNWSDTGTHHVPGIQPQDVSELLAHDSETVVLTRGMLLRLRTMPGEGCHEVAWSVSGAGRLISHWTHTRASC